MLEKDCGTEGVRDRIRVTARVKVRTAGLRVLEIGSRVSEKM